MGPLSVIGLVLTIRVGTTIARLTLLCLNGSSSRRVLGGASNLRECAWDRPLRDVDHLRSIVAHMGNVLEPRQIDAKTKEVVAYVVSASNRGEFCLYAHAGVLGQHGVDDAGITEILATAELWEEITRFAIGADLHWPES